jgi:hypothetical protein
MTNFLNPAYIMPAVILGALLVYFLYYAIDKVGLETSTAKAVVTAKDYTPGSTSFINRIAAGRSWTQAQQQPDFYTVSLNIENEPTVALVTKDKFDRLEKNDRVRVTYRRTRISGRIEVMDVF